MAGPTDISPFIPMVLPGADGWQVTSRIKTTVYVSHELMATFKKAVPVVTAGEASRSGLPDSPTRVSRLQYRHLVLVSKENIKESESSGKGLGPHWLTKEDDVYHFTERSLKQFTAESFLVLCCG